jgi:hypothetical protein
MRGFTAKGAKVAKEKEVRILVALHQAEAISC